MLEIKKDIEDIFYTISLIGDSCDDLKRTESIVKTNNLIKKIEDINTVLRKDAENNSKFKHGDKVVVTFTNSKDFPTVCYVSGCEVSSSGKLSYHFRKIKKDGTMSSVGIRFWVGWNQGEILVDSYDEKIHGELKNK